MSGTTPASAPARVVLLGSRAGTSESAPLLPEPVGRVALVTAGRQEWEKDDAGLRAAVRAPAVNLGLWARAERVWQADPELATAHRALGDQVRALRHAYNVRLAPAMDAWIHLEELAEDEAVLGPERTDALEAVRALDAHNLDRLRGLRGDFEDRWRPLERSAVAREHEELARLLSEVGGVVVDGGHVPVLLNRLRLFGLGDLLGGKTVVARSGGAMALARRVVLFHDSPPWGPGHSEVGEAGLGLYGGVLAFPLAAKRLRLDDPGRVSRLARRFAPDACVLLDPGTRATLEDGRWSVEGARRLDVSGTPEAWRPAA